MYFEIHWWFWIFLYDVVRLVIIFAYPFKVYPNLFISSVIKILFLSSSSFLNEEQIKNPHVMIFITVILKHTRLFSYHCPSVFNVAKFMQIAVWKCHLAPCSLCKTMLRYCCDIASGWKIHPLECKHESCSLTTDIQQRKMFFKNNYQPEKFATEREKI